MDEELEYLIQQIASKQEELSNTLEDFLHHMRQTRDEIDDTLRISRLMRALGKDTTTNELTHLANSHIDTSGDLIAYDDALTSVLDSVNASAESALAFVSRVHSLRRQLYRLNGIADSMDM